MVGARFLDLCRPGAVSIEALSRGASLVTFVDGSAGASLAIWENLETYYGRGWGGRAGTAITDAEDFLRAVAGDEHLAWDVAYFDPPYAVDYSAPLELFGEGQVFKRPGGVLVVEHHPAKKLPERVGVLRSWRSVRLGDSCLSFYEQKNARARVTGGEVATRQMSEVR